MPDFVMPDPFNLERFLGPQDAVYDDVLSELRAGRKRTHWMWFVFPQIIGLGYSAPAVRFAMTSLAEARAYLAHPILGPRLHECTSLVLQAGTRSIGAIFDPPDDLKFRSSMTLFDVAAPNTEFGQALQKFFAGEPDPATLAKLTGAGT